MSNMIKKIILDLDGKEVKLTSKQAKQLKQALDEMFGEKVIKEIHYHDDYDYWHWHRPLWHDFTTTWTSNDCVSSFDSGTLRVSLTGQ